MLRGMICSSFQAEMDSQTALHLHAWRNALEMSWKCLKNVLINVLFQSYILSEIACNHTYGMKTFHQGVKTFHLEMKTFHPVSGSLGLLLFLSRPLPSLLSSTTIAPCEVVPLTSFSFSLFLFSFSLFFISLSLCPFLSLPLLSLSFFLFVFSFSPFFSFL